MRDDLYRHVLRQGGVTHLRLGTIAKNGHVWELRAAAALWWHRRQVPVSTIARWLYVSPETVLMHVGTRPAPTDAGTPRRRGCDEPAVLVLAASFDATYELPQVEDAPAAPEPTAAMEEYRLCESALTLVASEYMLPERAILGRDRTDEVVDARRMLIGLLAAMDVPISHIGRFLGRDHSTIVHHHRWIEAHPEGWVRSRLEDLTAGLRGQTAPDACKRGPSPALMRALYGGLQDHLDRHARLAVCAYAYSDLLGGRRPGHLRAAAQAGRGFLLLCRHAGTYEVTAAVLVRYGRGQYVGLLDSRIQRAGYGGMRKEEVAS